MTSLIDIIVTHYDEPWDVGKPFFDMIEHQRCVSNEEYTVILVQDGEEDALPWHELLSDYSFRTKIITIDHAGTAAARNAGLNAAKSQWVMFCDFDDMFNDLCSLRMILNNFPVDAYDVVWGQYATEEKWNGGNKFLNTVKELVAANTDCKLYRREFLEENNIRFNTLVPFHYAYMFNAVVMTLTTPFRIAMITSDFYLYMKTLREDSMLNRWYNAIESVNTRFERDIVLADIFHMRGNDWEYRKRIAFIIFSEYYRVYDPDSEDPPVPSEKFIEFYRAHRHILDKITPAELDVIKDEAETETMNIIQNIYNNYKKEYYFANDSITFNQWIGAINHNAPIIRNDVMPKLPIEQMNEAVEIRNDPITIKAEDYSITPEKDNHQKNNPRVAVYCGTYNTYANMVASAKSLLWHTKMDKVYFLIEDDTFPYELPSDIIECINVKDQKFFPETGPNYANPWSYMCMMRAAFTKLIPYDKILSFDIDIVVQEDIGCLWDIDLTDYYLAGVIEPQRQKSSQDPIYINFGVVMMNLAKLRNDGMDDQIIEALNTQKFGCPEQDAFNKFCAWHIYKLPNDYNATIYSHITGEAEHERIIHYAGIKFWRHYGQVKEYGMRPWSAIMFRQNELNGGEQENAESSSIPCDTEPV